MPTVNGFNTTQGILKYNAEELENYNTPVFNSSTTYSLGDYTIYQGKLYKYISNTPSSGSWNASKWSFVVLTDEVKTLFNDINTIEEEIPQPSDNNPLMNGIANSGISDDFSRSDHVHPKDNTKQDLLSFDSTPVQNSTNPVTSGGIYNALATKQNSLTFDNTPTKDSINPVKSNGIYESILKLYPINEASGSIASFSDGADGIPMKSVVCEINPVQDLHGYDNPWPAGGGKNLIPLTLANLKANNTSGTWSGNTYTVGNSTVTVKTDSGGNVTEISVSTNNSSLAFVLWNLPSFDGQVIMNGCPSGGSTSTYKLQYSNYVDGAVNETGAGTSAFSQYDTTTYPNARVQIGINTGTYSNLVFKPMIRLSSVSDATFAPFSNICPISGFTGTNVFLSDNFPVQFEDGKYWDDNGTLANSLNTRYETEYIPVFQKSYTFAFGATSTNRVRVHEYSADKTWLRQVISQTVSNLTVSYTPSNDAKFIRYSYPIACLSCNFYLSSFPISWQTEAGTVYKCYINLITGQLVITGANVNIGGTASISTIVQVGNLTRFWIAGPVGKKFVDGGAICDKLASLENAKYDTNDVGIGNGSDSYPNSFWVKLPSSIIGTTEASIQAYLSNNSLQIVYDLATPIIYQLSAVDILSFLGNNNLWHTANGNITAIYRADPTLFVNNKIIQAVASVLNS